MNYYSSIFILWELSTPFLNVHWFMDKVNMTGTKAQLYNGILLLFSFFTARLVFGTYHSYCVMVDLWRAMNTTPTFEKLTFNAMAFVNEDTTVPVWAALSYLSSNLTLNFLNFYWFFKMVAAVQKRFVPSKKPTEPLTEAEIDMSSITSAIPEKQKVTRRKA